MNYIGSKLKLKDWIFEIIESKEKVDGKVFCDLFAGTGIIGKTAKEKGAIVIANDLQTYSYILNKRNIECSKQVDVPVIIPKKGVITDLYGNLYFKSENCEKCDGYIEYIKNLKDEEEKISLLASLIEGMDEVANTASVYGAFLKKIKKAAQKDLQLKTVVVEGQKGKVYNCKAEDLIKEISGDILYLDPPYNSRQYSSNYHVLETIARMDNPNVHGKTLLRDDCQKSDFCIKKKALSSLEEIIKNAKFKYIFMSYNNEGIISLEEIKNLFSKYGKYSVEQKEYKKFNSGSGVDKKNTIEYIHILEKSNE